MYHIESQDKHPIDHWQTYFHQLFRHRSPFHQCLYHTNNSNNKNNTKRTSEINIKKRKLGKKGKNQRREIVKEKKGR